MVKRSRRWSGDQGGGQKVKEEVRRSRRRSGSQGERRKIIRLNLFLCKVRLS